MIESYHPSVFVIAGSNFSIPAPFFPIKRFVIIAFPTVVSPVGTQFFLSNRSDPISRNDFGILRNIFERNLLEF